LVAQRDDSRDIVAQFRDIDITGLNRSGVGNFNLEQMLEIEPSVFNQNTNMQSFLQQEKTQWNFAVQSSGPFEATNVEQGAFQYYSIEPGADATGGVADPEIRGDKGVFMFQSNDLITIATYEYYIVYEVSYEETYFRSWVNRVFLCRKKQ
jgi:hypothetical protein